MTLRQFAAIVITTPVVLAAAAQNNPVFKVGGGVSAPTTISSPDPIYPEAARNAKYECSAVLWTVVTPDGHTRDTKVARPCGMGMDEAALDAVKKWTFKPAMKDGQPVAVQVNIEVNFRLNGGAAATADDAQTINATLKAGDYQHALPELESYVRKHPESGAAWNALGEAQLQTRHLDDALASFRHAADLNDVNAQGNIGRALMMLHRNDEAVGALKKAVELAPSNALIHFNLAAALMGKADYAAAAKELENMPPGTTLPHSSVLYSLGYCYLHLHEPEKAVAAFENALAENRTPAMLTAVAYQYAGNEVEFQRARELVRTAQAIDIAALRSVDLAHVSADDYARVASLAREWDTMGWIEYKQHVFPAAEPYLHAAWELDHSPVVAQHLGELYDKSGAVHDAMHWYALSDVLQPSPEVHKRLLAFAGAESKLKEAEDEAQAEKTELDKFTVPNTAKLNGASDFAVEVAPGPKIAEVKIKSGDAALEPIVKAEVAKATFPQNAEAVVIRRGTVRCAPEWPNCEGTLLTASEAEAAARKEVVRPPATLALNGSVQPVTYTSTSTSVRVVMPPGWHLMSDQAGSYNHPSMFVLLKAGTAAVFAASREHLELSGETYQKIAEQHIPQMLEDSKVTSDTPITRSGVPATRLVVIGKKNGMECRAWVEVLTVGDEHYVLTAIAPAERFTSYAAEFEKMLSSVVIPGTSGGTLSDSSLPK